MTLWSSVTSYIMTSGKNYVYNFDGIQRQHSTMVIQFEILLMADKQTLLIQRKRTILILLAGIEKYHHHCS